MALGDYILCDRCNCKLIYDGDMGNREWWIERFGKEPEILCPPCQQEMAIARVQVLGQAMDDVRTRPPKIRDLSDDEIDKAWRSVDYTVPYDQFRINVARAIIAAAREKE